MAEIGIHFPHERFAPKQLLQWAELAGAAGFRHAMCSDHFHPWSTAQGQSGYAWTWLGAAAARTHLSLGTVTAPGQRYHPAIIAQAAATMAEMYPNRFWFALGTGQLLNEGITGKRWPAKAERQARLLECVQVMRALWQGETVTHHGLIDVEEAKLYTRPATPPPAFCAALTPETARWAGRWADGLLTGGAPPEQTRRMVDAFRSGGGRGPVYLQVSVLLGKSREEGAAIAHEHWRMNVLGPHLQAELRSPSQFEAASRFVTPDQMAETVRISADPTEHADWIHQDFAAGADRVYLNHVGCDIAPAIEYAIAKIAPSIPTA